jgi:23S rRNA (adenine-N6)-dimethyltransferase
MAKRPNKKICLAQNFLKSPGLVRRLLRHAAIGPEDTVCEIGPGKGIITAELARTAKKIVAVEKDASLVRTLRERFRSADNVEIHAGNFLTYSLPRQPHKIFANIPYNATAEIVRKILFAAPSTTEAYLIMQREAARKFSGVPNETSFSLLAKPYFEFRIIAQLRRTDFHPVPSVASVLLRIRRRDRSLLLKEDTRPYRDFVNLGFTGWNRNLRSAFKHVFTYPQWKRLARELRFSLNATPTELSFDQWIGLYQGLKYLTRSTGAKPGARRRSARR